MSDTSPMLPTPDQPVFRSEAELAAEYESYRDWPAPERLLARVTTVFDMLNKDERDLDLAKQLTRHLSGVIHRAARLGVLTLPQYRVIMLNMGLIQDEVAVLESSNKSAGDNVDTDGGHAE